MVKVGMRGRPPTVSVGQKGPPPTSLPSIVAKRTPEWERYRAERQAKKAAKLAARAK